MTDKDPGETAGVPEEGSGAAASGPQPDFDAETESSETESADEELTDLTVDDILNAEQTGEAADADLTAEEASHLHDLKRLTAEYANYRRRTEDQRLLEIQRAKGEVAKNLLPVLDDLDRAAQHGDLIEGTPFAVIGEKVRAVAERLGVVSYGAKDDEFDPQHHEAIFQQPTPGVEKAIVLEVVEVGYRLGDVELRPAKVVVAVPAE